jgi:hypothetical protein
MGFVSRLGMYISISGKPHLAGEPVLRAAMKRDLEPIVSIYNQLQPSRTLIEIEGGIYINGRHNRAGDLLRNDRAEMPAPRPGPGGVQPPDYGGPVGGQRGWASCPPADG